MGVRRDGLRHRYTSPNAINTFSNIEPVIVIYLLIPTSTSCTTTPTISYLGVRVAGLGPIYNSSITTNSILYRIQKFTTFALVREVKVACQRPISTYPFNIKLLFHNCESKSGWSVVT